MPRQVTYQEGLELTRKSGLFTEEELQRLATGHALDSLKYLLETPPPAPRSAAVSPSAEGSKGDAEMSGF